MNNFYEFIKKDIESKKNLLSTLPTKTKTNKRKYNQELEKIRKKYDEYRLSTRNYLVAKSKKIDIKDNREDVDKLKKKILELNNVKFLLNPTNTYLEKMGFDELLYKINNFDTFNFDSLNDIINGFLDKFSLVGILLTGDDFDYTCYVHEYMTSYLKASRSASKDYSKVSEIFEQIYWVNPDLIHHIELNFRKLIKINEKKFTNYIVELQKEVMEKNGITNYAACLEKLQEQYIDLNLYKRENVSDIIELSKKNVINIEQYMPGNKVRTMAFMSLIPEGIDYSDNKTMKKICFSLEKLRDNIDEFNTLLAAICGSVLVGLGCAITFKGGGSTGGLDILAFIGQKYFKIKCSIGAFVIDALIILCGFLVFRNLTSTVIGIIGAFLCSAMIEKVFIGYSSTFVAQIISDKYEEINDFIINTLGRGSTLLEAEGGYSNEHRKVIMVAFDRKEYTYLIENISKIDPKAFITITLSHEVNGEGFASFPKSKL